MPEITEEEKTHLATIADLGKAVKSMNQVCEKLEKTTTDEGIADGMAVMLFPSTFDRLEAAMRKVKRARLMGAAQPFDPDFVDFMAKVDKIIGAKIQMSHEDLDDYCYRDDFDCGEEPADTAREAMQNSDYEVE